MRCPFCASGLHPLPPFLPSFLNPSSPLANTSNNNYFEVGIYPPNLSLVSLQLLCVHKYLATHYFVCPQNSITAFILNVSFQNLLLFSWHYFLKMYSRWYKQIQLIHCINAPYFIYLLFFTHGHSGYFLLFGGYYKQYYSKHCVPFALACCSSLLSYQQGVSSVFLHPC